MRIPTTELMRKTSESITTSLDRFLTTMQMEQSVNKELEEQYKNAYKAERLGDITIRTMDALEDLQEARSSNKELYDASMQWLGLTDPLANMPKKQAKTK